MAENFEIVGQRQTWIPGLGAGFEQVIEISFKTLPSGVLRFVEIPISRYNGMSAAQLHDVIAPIAADTEDKHNI